VKLRKLCIDCGGIIEVSGSQKRCVECQKKAGRKARREASRRYYRRQKGLPISTYKQLQEKCQKFSDQTKLYEEMFDSQQMQIDELLSENKELKQQRLNPCAT